MNHNSKNFSSESSDRHTFMLIDELPGPSVGDAADHLEQFGVDPWQFDEIQLVEKIFQGQMVAATFAAIGPRTSIEALYKALQSTALRT